MNKPVDQKQKAKKYENTTEQPKWVERREKRVKMAGERNALVMRGNSPFGRTIHHILQQFDNAYAQFKIKLGELGGIPHEEGDKLMVEAQDILIQFNDFTDKLHKRVRFTYHEPQELRDLKKAKQGKV